MARRFARGAPLALAAALAGCSLAPRYAVPPTATPVAFKEVPPGWAMASPAAGAQPAAWWQAFGDPRLDALEAQLETANPSLAAALARYDQARGALREADAALAPQVSLGGSVGRQRVSGNRPIAVGGAATYTDYRIGPSASWEIDLFGRLRDQVRAGRAEVEASAADVAGTRLALQVSLASAYFEMRGLDARTRLLEETVAAFQRAYDLTDVRHQGGIASGLDTSRSRALLASARAELAAVHAARAAYEHAVAALVGVPASSFALAVDARQPAPPVFAAGTPSTLLQRRPDIDAAERRIAAANARIGVARAALFPVLSLGAGGGFETTGANLLSKASSYWALGPAALALPLFDGGARRARLRIARAQFEEAAAAYRQTVLTAFREVEDDFAQNRWLIDQVRDTEEAARAAERTRDLALVRYRDGASDYLEVVTAQTAALDAERALLQLRTQQITTAVDTVRALGGATG
ncbi:efflux transporter outer membrane subunit [Sphingomonas morindae]|uniref:Efflux transporter outer membrane subunit n=1 Tax=Sphingomonas morindae TaxID=1541170 RepID=A0ABY4XD21_9SPHN|nr:efflux transporter outer membrane subunit [Sphingomonas morindae]USI74875.1 efflux transporter outer membrane subunit [Sphingomonas morindae]